MSQILKGGQALRRCKRRKQQKEQHGHRIRKRTWSKEMGMER